MTRLALFVCTFGYLGYFPVAPGTLGSAAGVLVYAALRYADAGPVADAVVIVILFVAGVWSGSVAERHFGRTDPGVGVIDEVTGMLITLFLVPPSPAAVIAAFAAFRALDVLKPFPARRLESLHGGLGMMADDCMAGVYANLCTRALAGLFPLALVA
jgi:phosphatidylglycerophosphatase A